MKLLVWCNALLLSCLFSLSVFAGDSLSSLDDSLSPDVVGSICVIRHDDRLVMVKENITQKLSMPGGYIDGDSPSMAAVREAYEESGLRVKAVKRLNDQGRAAVYSCVATSPIKKVRVMGDERVVAWTAPHFSREVNDVVLIDPSEIAPEDYRFSDDYWLLPVWLAQTPESEGIFVSDMTQEINSLHRAELDYMLVFRAYVESLPLDIQHFFDGLMHVLNMPGENYFIILFLIGLAAWFGPVYLLEFATLLLIALMTTSLLKYGLAVPRPAYVLPELQQISIKGFSFPSGHTIIAATMVLYVWFTWCTKLSQAMRVVTFLVALFLICGQAVARVWYGVHYPTDTLVSIGMASMLVSLWWLGKPSEVYSLSHLAKRRGFWLSLTLFQGVVASLTLIPAHTYLFATLLGVFISVETINRHHDAVYTRVKVLLLFVLLVGTVAIFWLINAVANQFPVSLLNLSIRSVGACLLAMWLVIGSSLLPEFLQKRLSQKL